jgi:ornithine carbamoyltransferase
MKSLKGKSILRIKDLTPTELSYLIEEGLNFKKNKKISSKNIGKKAVCFFSKSSSRTKSA